MDSKKSYLAVILTALLIVFLYIIFAIKPLNTEYQLIPEWKIDVTNPPVQEVSEDTELLDFRFASSMGYFTEDGKVSNFVKFPFKATISKDYYASYSQNNTSCDFFSKDGKKAGTIKVPGFPFFQDSRLFVLLPGGNSFEALNEKGEKKWQHDASCPITAFNSSEGGVIAGYASGLISVFDNDGKNILEYAPGGSEFPVILGADISKDGQYMASVSGQNRQRFVIGKNDGTHVKIVFHEFLDAKNTSQDLVKFSSDSRYVYFDADGIFGIADIQKGKSKHIKISGKAISIKESDSNIFLLTKEKDRYFVYIIEKATEMTESFSFKSDSAFIETLNGNLYVGQNQTISKIKIEKK